MKILHIITSLRTGGAEKLMVDLLPRLRDLGNDVELLLFDGARTPFYDKLEKTGIKIHSLSIGGNVYNPLNILKLRKYLKRYDIVHTHNTACQLFAAVCSVLCSVVLVSTEHTTSNRRRGWKWYAPIDRWMYSRYKYIIGISTHTTLNLINHIRSNKNIITIHNGIKLEDYVNHKDNFTPNGDVIITMIAGFRPQKDHDTLIRAMTKLPKNYKLWLIGDGERRNLLISLVDNLQLHDRVTFWGIRKDIPNLISQSHVNVLSSHYEGFGLAAVEAMAAKRPVIACDIDGIREVVGNAGILFPPQNADILAHEIKSLCENPIKYKNIAQKCLIRAKLYDISIMAEKYNNLYKNIINNES